MTINYLPTLLSVTEEGEIAITQHGANVQIEMLDASLTIGANVFAKLLADLNANFKAPVEVDPNQTDLSV